MPRAGVIPVLLAAVTAALPRQGLVLFALGFHTACFLMPMDPVRHLDKWERELEQFAQLLGKTEVNHTFVRLPGGSIVWNGVGIEAEGDGFMVRGNTSVLSLEDAARAIGADPKLLVARIESARALQIYSARVSPGEVVLLLDGSALVATGLLYVMPGEDEWFAKYQSYVRQGRNHYGWTTFEYVRGRWFRFSE